MEKEKIAAVYECSIKECLGNRAEPTIENFGLWLLKENLDNDNLLTNIGDIDYTNGEEKLKKFEPISEPFCDNIMMVIITDSQNCYSKNGKLLATKEVCGKFNNVLRDKFKIFNLGRRAIVAKPPYKLDSDSQVVTGVMQIIGKKIESVKENYKEPVVIPYKIELADVNLGNLLLKLPDIIEELEKKHYYLLDFDITQDFAGIFNKDEMSDYLRKNHNFCFQSEYKEDCNVIVDDDKSTGIDCLTWKNGSSRVKIYSKYICQLTNPGMSKQLGNHIINLVNCPNARLKQTFNDPRAANNGITRLEATIYNYTDPKFKVTHEVLPLYNCNAVIEDNKKYFESAPFYSVPLSKMWTKLTNKLKNSCCVVSKNLLQYAYWGNTSSKKLTGVQIKLPGNQTERTKCINYVLSAYSFKSLPLNYLEILENTEQLNVVSIIQKCFIKKEGETYFSRSRCHLSTIPVGIDIKKIGLIETTNVKPLILRKRPSVRMEPPYKIKETNPITKAYIQSRNKREREFKEISIKSRKKDFLNKTRSVLEDNKNLIEQYQKIKETEEEIKNYFSKGLINFDITGIYKIKAIILKIECGSINVGFLGGKGDEKVVYFLKGCYNGADSHRDNLREKGFMFSYGTVEIVYYPVKDDFFEFTANGTIIFNASEIKPFEITNSSYMNQLLICKEDVAEIENIKMGTIECEIKVKDCKTLEDLKEGDNLLISHIQAKSYYGRDRYILMFENRDDYYVSNYWLENEIKCGNKDINFKLKIRLDIIETTPKKKKERLVFVA
ncbi:uncharacterized protein LOC124552478 [Schistocerca americana]|uniref:uncharacterized protein LOC124552478 n=1 Tax=Schistocerca americana TaxID=7009 RepID=UPI001F4FDFE0|nr:uncharacterized protein LOC124552478 [Schistocerca americana]